MIRRETERGGLFDQIHVPVVDQDARPTIVVATGRRITAPVDDHVLVAVSVEIGEHHSGVQGVPLRLRDEHAVRGEMSLAVAEVDVEVLALSAADPIDLAVAIEIDERLGARLVATTGVDGAYVQQPQH